ncbi:LOW QUALITY PROTEIN: hypothetical protein YC2023_059895 [Brassica napus]
MALVFHCTSCTWLQRKTFPINRRYSPNIRRRATTCEFRIPKSPVKQIDELWLFLRTRFTVHDSQRGVVHEFEVPEEQYILHSAESQNINLPFACRHGCCTSCAVRVKSGDLRQPQALGISAELKSQGYALLCVGFPTSDLEVETQNEDESKTACKLQQYFILLSFHSSDTERDDYALELAMGDE